MHTALINQMKGKESLNYSFGMTLKLRLRNLLKITSCPLMAHYAAIQKFLILTFSV